MCPSPRSDLSVTPTLSKRSCIPNHETPLTPILTPYQTTLLSLPYSTWYETRSPSTKPFVLLAFLFILTFLFSFIGITASDFFCPNLSTIATYLGLNESTAGVTLLAFGNGSPDVFSTFSALEKGTFGLAIGELIGAASFSEFRDVLALDALRVFLSLMDHSSAEGFRLLLYFTFSLSCETLYKCPTSKKPRHQATGCTSQSQGTMVYSWCDNWSTGQCGQVWSDERICRETLV